MTDEPQLSSDAGCLGTFVSVAVVALILTVAMNQWFDSPALYIPVFIVTTIAFVSIGFPLYLVAHRFGWETIWGAMTCGAVTGGAFPLVGALSDSSAQAWREAAAYTATGVVGGLVFFLAATVSRNRARNIAWLIGITGIAVALTPQISDWL